MAFVECPVGNRYYHWPPFSISNLVSVPSSVNLNTDYLEPDPVASQSISPCVKVIDLSGVNKTGLHIEAKFEDVIVSGTGILNNYQPGPIGIAIDSSIPSMYSPWGFWYGDAVSTWPQQLNYIWFGRYGSFNVLLGIDRRYVNTLNLTFEVDVISASGSDYIAQFTCTIYNPSDGLTTVFGPVLDTLNFEGYLWVFGSLSYWENDNTGKLTDLLVYCPGFTGGGVCTGPEGPEPEFDSSEYVPNVGDIKLFVNNGVSSLAEIRMDSVADIKRDPTLENSILISLFTDRRSEVDDVLPDNSNDKRGYWGDTIEETTNDSTGSRLWLLGRNKMEDNLLSFAEEYTRESLDWMIEDGVAEEIDVLVEKYDDTTILINLTIKQAGEDNDIFFKYYYNWKEQILKEVNDAT